MNLVADILSTWLRVSTTHPHCILICVLATSLPPLLQCYLVSAQSFLPRRPLGAWRIRRSHIIIQTCGRFPLLGPFLVKLQCDADSFDSSHWHLSACGMAALQLLHVSRVHKLDVPHFCPQIHSCVLAAVGLWVLCPASSRPSPLPTSCSNVPRPLSMASRPHIGLWVNEHESRKEDRAARRLTSTVSRLDRHPS